MVWIVMQAMERISQLRIRKDNNGYDFDHR